MASLTTVLVWHLSVTAVLVTVLVAIMFVQYAIRSVQRLARSRGAVQNTEMAERRLQDAA